MDITCALKDFTSQDPTQPSGPSAPTPSAIPIGSLIGSMRDDDGSPADIEALPELVDYNERFRDADPVLFRDGAIEETIGALIGKKKPNALLIGPAGCGKTAVVEDLARRLANRDASIPEQLEDAVVYELDLPRLVSAGGIVGALESRVDSIVEALKGADHPCVLFIDEIHRLVKNAGGGNNPYGVISQALKPVLARAEFMCIGATTMQESKSFMNDPAFSRRFTRVIIEELTREQTVSVLECVWPSMCRHYKNKVRLAGDSLKSVAAIADELSPADQHRPDNAITLLDRSCADAIIRRQRTIAETDDPTTRQQMKSMPTILSSDNVRRVAMRAATGHATPDKLDLDALRCALSRVLGQDEPIAAVVRALRKRDLHLFDEGKPLSMLFAGPSGVGKSEVARVISDVLFHEEPITLNMTEFSDPATINRIIGSPQGYVGSTWDNELPFDGLASNPYRVVLLDEFEKAHPSVQRLFMSALEDGYFKTNLSVTVSFDHAIVIATTNANHSTGKRSAIGFEAGDDVPDPAAQIDGLTGWFDSELLNRFDVVTTFNAIGRDTYAEILAADWQREAARVNGVNANAVLPDELDEGDLWRLVDESYVPAFGARPAHRAVTSEIERILLDE